MHLEVVLLECLDVGRRLVQNQEAHHGRSVDLGRRPKFVRLLPDKSGAPGIGGGTGCAVPGGGARREPELRPAARDE
jgi:hypothetical protein